jgi:hypothetical protein
VPYLLLGLQDIQWAVGNSRGAGKLVRTPHVNKNKKTKKNVSFDLLHPQILNEIRACGCGKEDEMVPPAIQTSQPTECKLRGLLYTAMFIEADKNSWLCPTFNFNNIC